MRKRTRGMLGLLLSCVMVFTMAQMPSINVHAEEGGVGGFVNRCYQVTLGRAADPTGYADWTNQLTSGKSDGAYVAFGFVFSPEYTNANKTNEDFVTDMYTLFLGRTPDEAGYRDWVNQLNNGADRQAIFAGFANSNEFYNICTSYGVTAGVHVPGYDRAQVNNVNMFVARMYKVCLNRIGDKEGQNDWVNRLLHGELSGTDCAHGFIYSNEYQNLGLTDEEYVENMYTAFMGRQSDPNGFNDWVSKLKAGYTRDEIFAGFANSNEFQSICNSYGIVGGSYTPSDVHEEVSSPILDQILMPDLNEDSTNTYIQEHGWRIVELTDESGTEKYNYNGKTQYDYTVTAYDKRSKKEYTTQKVSYDAASNTITLEMYNTENGQTIVAQTIKISIKPLGGNLYEYTMVPDSSGNNIYSATIVLELTSDGKRLIKSMTEYDENRKVVYAEKYEYDSQNRLKKVTETERNNVLASISTFEYDANGTQTRTNSFYEEDGKTVYDRDKEVTYYVNGRKIKTEEYHTDANTVSVTTEFEYDKYGNLTKETTNRYGSKTITTYKYAKY